MKSLLLALLVCIPITLQPSYAQLRKSDLLPGLGCCTVGGRPLTTPSCATSTFSGWASPPWPPSITGVLEAVAGVLDPGMSHLSGTTHGAGIAVRLPDERRDLIG